ncbi:acyltransferase family protein [Luteimonas dalianensis]|uniref:acyltransferase family protein n=1 Tax=Luteimonas dalianensis TaxID=1148196 RepID=UPI003BF20DA5
MTASDGVKQRAGLRADIQALRAVAVLTVLVFHVWPTAMPGGYVGVDVFFVISGFLITGVLLKDLDRGGLDFRRFYARRIRRLLPAASLTLVVTLLVAWLVLPGSAVRSLAVEVLASALYVVNWLFVSNSVDYLAGGGAPSAVTHYWSLSIEEQFYILWPLVIFGAVLVARRANASARLVSGWLLGLMIVASLAWAIHLSFVNPAPAYFMTTTRVWELGVGSMIAILGMKLPASRTGWASLLALGGLAAIMVSALFYDTTLPFPGYEATLPVAGAAGVIVAGVTPGSLLGRVFSLRPLQYIGDISYSLYLWHWPVVVLYPYVAGRNVEHFADVFTVVGVSMLFAHASKAWVEDRFRSPSSGASGHHAGWASAPGIAVFATGAVLAGSLLVLGGVTSRTVSVAVADENYPGAFAGHSPAVAVPIRPVMPDPDFGGDDRGPAYGGTEGTPRCIARWNQTDLMECVYGAPEARPHIVLIGDSHAVHWLPAFEELAENANWRVTGLTKDSCAFTDVMLQYGRRGQPARDYTECKAWRELAMARILDERPDLVVVSYSPRHRIAGLDHSQSQSSVAEGTVRLARALIDSGIQVAAIKHTPWNRREIPDCVATNADDWNVCSTERQSALGRAALSIVAERSPEVTLLDFDATFCTQTSCPPVMGNVLVYRDSHHLSATFSRTMWKELYDRLEFVD